MRSALAGAARATPARPAAAGAALRRPLPLQRLRTTHVVALARRSVDTSLHIQARTLKKASEARPTLEACLQAAATEAELDAKGLREALKSPIVRAKHPHVVTLVQGGKIAEAAAYLRVCRADTAHIIRLLLMSCPKQCCPRLRSAEARDAFIGAVLAKHPVLFLVPLADVASLVRLLESLFGGEPARHRLLRPLAVCLARGTVPDLRAGLASQLAALRGHLPDLTHALTCRFFLSNPLGLLRTHPAVLARGIVALAASLGVEPSEALRLSLGNSHALRTLLLTVARAAKAATLESALPVNDDGRLRMDQLGTASHLPVAGAVAAVAGLSAAQLLSPTAPSCPLPAAAPAPRGAAGGGSSCSSSSSSSSSAAVAGVACLVAGADAGASSAPLPQGKAPPLRPRGGASRAAAADALTAADPSLPLPIAQRGRGRPRGRPRAHAAIAAAASGAVAAATSPDLEGATRSAVDRSSFVLRQRLLVAAAGEASRLGNPKWAAALSRATAPSRSTLACYGWPRYLRLAYLLSSGRHAQVALSSALTYDEPNFQARHPGYVAWVEGAFGGQRSYDEVCGALVAQAGGQGPPLLARLLEGLRRQLRPRAAELRLAAELLGAASAMH